MKTARLICLGLCVALATLILFLDHVWEPLACLELQTLDRRFQERGPRPPRDPVAVALIAIDEKGLTEMGRQFTPAESSP